MYSGEYRPCERVGPLRGRFGGARTAILVACLASRGSRERRPVRWLSCVRPSSSRLRGSWPSLPQETGRRGAGSLIPGRLRSGSRSAAPEGCRSARRSNLPSEPTGLPSTSGWPWRACASHRRATRATCSVVSTKPTRPFPDPPRWGIYPKLPRTPYRRISLGPGPDGRGLRERLFCMEYYRVLMYSTTLPCT